MTLYAESAADQADHLADAFVRENVAKGYYVVTTLWRSKVVYSRAICLEKFSVRKGMF